MQNIHSPSIGQIAKKALFAFAFPLCFAPLFMARGDEPKSMIETVPDVAIFAQSGDDEVGETFAEILSRGDARGDHGLIATVFPSIEQAVKSDADVVVIALGRSVKPFSDDLVAASKQKKIIGIGYGAAQLFGKMELEITGDSCAHFVDIPSLLLQDCRLLGKIGNDVPIVTYAKPTAADNFGMFLPEHGEQAGVVDVIARHSGKPNYAPIVKQNNYVLIGASGLPSAWSPEYQKLFREIAIRLRKSEKQPFAKAEFNVSAPGKYAVVLGKGRSTQQRSGKKYYFRFSKPTNFTATFRHQGSENLMMLFMGQKNRLHWTRTDAKHGEALTINVQISADDLKFVGDNYWTLEVTNFDQANPATGVLDIQYGSHH